MIQSFRRNGRSVTHDVSNKKVNIKIYFYSKNNVRPFREYYIEFMASEDYNFLTYMASVPNGFQAEYLALTRRRLFLSVHISKYVFIMVFKYLCSH